MLLCAEFLRARAFEQSRVEFKASDETKREVKFLVSKEVKFCAFGEAISGADIEFKASGAMGTGAKEVGLKAYCEVCASASALFAFTAPSCCAAKSCARFCAFISFTASMISSSSFSYIN